MSTGQTVQPDPVAWARRVNSRWIVHQGLKETAEAYLEHLEAVDPARLIRSCEQAHHLAQACDPGEDPKPWFYAGLFSLSAPAEARRFLAGHWFTAACIHGFPADLARTMEPQNVRPETRDKLNRIRRALATHPPGRA